MKINFIMYIATDIEYIRINIKAEQQTKYTGYFYISELSL